MREKEEEIQGEAGGNGMENGERGWKEYRMKNEGNRRGKGGIRKGN